MSAGARPKKSDASDDFARTIAAQLAPIVARADEKAGLLADMLAEMQNVPALESVRGLAPTIRKLAARHGEEAVAAAASALMERVRAWGSTRERVT